MHTAHWSPPGAGTIGPAPTDARTNRADRLDLLVRAIRLQSDSVALALSPSPTSERTRQSWEALFDQAEHLGRQWAISDPVDALQLLPSLLSGLRGVTQHFKHGYSDALQPKRPQRQAAPLQHGACDACDAVVTHLGDDMADDMPFIACPCCGHAWT